MFLIGYASFMEEKFEDAVNWLRRMLTSFPGNDLAPDATYWTAMAQLFDKRYETAAPDFERVIEQYASSPYVEDATFRRAVCDYGMGKYEASDGRLAAFVEAYPESKLVSEATMMRGDLAGSFGRTDAAVRLYQEAARDPALNVEYYNHCAFQAGRILVDHEKYDEMIAHYRRYIDANREGSNVPLAVYWIGVGLWNKGEREGALRFYRQAVERYGTDRKAVGIDMILDEWVGRIRRSEPDEAQRGWAELQASLDRAVSGTNRTMELRFKRILLYSPRASSTEKQRIVNEFLSPANLAAASPAVLQSMLDLARERKRRDAAVRTARHMIAAFTETDYALDARMVLAEYAIDTARAASNPLEAREAYEEAVMHLDVVREVFASSAEAARALLLLGRLYREQGKYETADEQYKAVLGVKGWRNVWPEALYWRGECAFAQRKYDVASAYYERIYVMYSHYTAWTSRAYLRRAECLRKMYQDEKARAVLEEMMGNGELRELPEYERAKAMLIRLGGNV
jgi:TolA-binding protein